MTRRRRDVATRAQYDATPDPTERLALLEAAVKSLATELMSSSSRAPHEFTASVPLAHLCQCGLRRASPIHHPALRLVSIVVPERLIAATPTRRTA